MTTVQTLLQSEVLTVPKTDLVSSVIPKMAAARCGSVLVMEEARLWGIFTERDLLTRVLGPKLDPAVTPVSEVASRNPISVTDHYALKDCARMIAEYGFRHLAVVNREQKLVGIVSSRDILEHLLRNEASVYYE